MSSKNVVPVMQNTDSLMVCKEILRSSHHSFVHAYTCVCAGPPGPQGYNGSRGPPGPRGLKGQKGEPGQDGKSLMWDTM